MKGKQVSILSSKFCTVQVLVGPKNLSAFKVSGFGSILKYCINSTSIETLSSGHYWEVSVKGGSTVISFTISPRTNTKAF